MSLKFKYRSKLCKETENRVLLMGQLQNFQDVSNEQLILLDKIKNCTQEIKLNYPFATFDVFSYIIN